jgi:UTP--glucose-1-phosphate uridylyltransferase
VFTTREHIGSEPFLLMLGDHIYRSNNAVSCARQMVDAYNQHGVSVVGLKRTPEAHIGSFGVVTGTWLEEGRLLNITEFAEKPSVDYARSNLRVPQTPPDEYLTVFGQYIINPEIYDFLETNIRNNVRERGEFQLTSALDRLRRSGGFHGLVIDGRRFDIGIPEYYLTTLQEYSQR